MADAVTTRIATQLVRTARRKRMNAEIIQLNIFLSIVAGFIGAAVFGVFVLVIAAILEVVR